ncbi:hypothetical protein RAL01_004277 [Vibrio vulnificus]|uniref:hypothetical protein n=1 Tax=Vibrio vulnificus TaxID=672 RepID=UPI0009B67421|nr:hypothetical protein [Vibrio vulnificus]EIC2299342.1 hypothetical protein [Vibrio cholerae]EGR0637564.1 hypothetical protein [Vibrio vulnificus]EHK9068778.1 hypothetical protein [Vibrio vulnificus]EHU4802209.1 hypothetical protein [Vibrio vulnificus]EIA0806883.1 hypothetical protein [Vibrio vulnificus]
MDVNLAEKLIADVLTTKFGCEFEPVPSSQYPRHLNFRSEDYHFSFPANLLYEAGSKCLEQKISHWLQRDFDLIKAGSDVIYSENGEIMPDSVIAEE